MKYPQETLTNIFAALRTSPDDGLTAQLAGEIARQKGLNKFDEEKRETILRKILHHLKDFTSLILLAAVAISFLLALVEGHSFTDPIVIFSIVILNLILAIRQEMGAEKALEALRSINANMTVVIRDGTRQPVNAEELVPGDILLLEAGDLIPADARLIESVNLKLEESILTGESVAVEKDAGAAVEDDASIGDQLNMLFSGCLIINGRAKAVVTGTGMQTEMGKIAGLLNNTRKTKTPLQKRMDDLGRTLCFIALGAGAAMFAIMLLLLPLLHDMHSGILEVLMNAVALAVAVVPECLPVIVTITLAFGVHNMARKNAIIRKLPAVETLGSASVICSDKTGTLTMNRMTIQQLWAAGHKPQSAQDALGHDERLVLEMMGLASNATIEVIDGREKEIGDPTETAIVRLLREKGIDKKSLDAIYPKVHEIPFDSQRKLMTTVHQLEDTRYLCITKGAFDRIPVESGTDFAEARRVHDAFAGAALRVLAVACKYYDALPASLDSQELEHGLTFAGFVGMIDPPRPESMAAVRTAKEAGIQTVMITGDHAITASAIARQIGILGEGEKALTGKQLGALSDEELARDIRDYKVYARVSPEDKIRIVRAWQSHGEVVAMTGDGVNDAPALKAANVGVAMGSGTDVSKNASDIVLTDDNFASIVDAVAEGRRVYDNIRKVLYSLVSCNISEIFTMLLAILFGWGLPVAAIQLLFINVVADGVPDLCVCKEELEADAMQRPPVSPKASVFANGLTPKIAVMASVFAVASLVAFFLGKFVSIGGMEASHAIGQTMAFIVIGWTSVVNIFNVRSFTKSIFKIGFTSNRLLFLAILFSLGIVAAVATVPYVRDVFYCVPLSLYHWLIMIGLSASPLIVGEAQKLIIRRRERADG